MIELLGSADQAQAALLDQVDEGNAGVLVSLGDRDHEPEVGVDQSGLGSGIAAFDALRERYLLFAREQRKADDSAQEKVERLRQEPVLVGRAVDVLEAEIRSRRAHAAAEPSSRGLIGDEGPGATGGGQSTIGASDPWSAPVRRVAASEHGRLAPDAPDFAPGVADLAHGDVG